VHPSEESLRDRVEIYRQALREGAHDMETRQILGKFHIYVADSLAQGIREASPYMKNYSAIHAAVDPNRKLTHRDITLDMERGFIIVGDPQRCIDTILRWREKAGLTTFSFTFYFGGMPQEMALKNIRLFAERVMPALEQV
jgi:alkanesulfonate monooxygenase SsuD/methylene tetrahydromethanopterin reductase-like flavin-dependent oxidoreductase (luciferase family)